jgi:hypothetical protein
MEGSRLGVQGLKGRDVVLKNKNGFAGFDRNLRRECQYLTKKRFAVGGYRNMAM